MRTIRSLTKNESGATAIEYAILCALVAVFIIGGFAGAGDQITKIGGTIVEQLTKANGTGTGGGTGGNT